jgi:hypothetical protein
MRASGRERFREHGVEYEPALKPKSDIYREALPTLNGHRCELLDIPRLHTQLVGLERRTARGGRDSIDHAPGGHDDLCNSVCGVLVKLLNAEDTLSTWAKLGGEDEAAAAPVPEPEPEPLVLTAANSIDIAQLTFPGEAVVTIVLPHDVMLPLSGGRPIRLPMGKQIELPARYIDSSGYLMRANMRVCRVELIDAERIAHEAVAARR